MNVRLPLYAKILLWFFLNLALLVGLCALLLNSQLRLNLDSMLAGAARDRVEAVRNLIIGELNNTPTYEWDRVLERYSEVYNLKFGLLDDDGNLLVGAFDEVPQDVKNRINGRLPSSPPAESEASGPPRREGRNRWRRPPIRAFLRTGNPPRYWLLVGGRIDNPQAGPPMRVVVAAESKSLAGGGLIFDATPWLGLAAGATVFSLLFWFPFARNITHAIGRMTQATRRIADGRFDVRLHTRRRDELGDLSRTIDQMAARLDGFVKGQKRFLGDIAHELCAPLAKLQMTLGILEQKAAPGERSYVDAASEKARQIGTLVNELLAFSKASFAEGAVALKPIRVIEAAEEAIRRESETEAAISLEIDGQLAVLADRELLVRALGNLVRNAMRYAGDAGPIVIAAERRNDEVSIKVRDSGPGVPAEALPQIFDAFYRVEQSRARETGGVGLGLTIVKTCVEACGGTVTAGNRQPRGLEVKISLPAAKIRTESSAPEKAATEPAE